MLAAERAFAGFSVSDIDAALRFYRDTLGLDVAQMENGLLQLELPGGGRAIVYPKPGHEPAAFTILNFAVPDIEQAVADLTGNGVQMLRYDGFNQDELGISRNPGGPPIAWFADPAGNILAVLEE